MKSFLILFLIVSLSACGSDSTGSNASGSGLAGTYVSTNNLFSYELKPDGKILSFNGGILVHEGTYTVNGDQLSASGWMKPMKIAKDGSLNGTGTLPERFVKK